MKLLIRKLPFYSQAKWRNSVYELKNRKQTVIFENLVNFVRKEAKKANEPMLQQRSYEQSNTCETITK